jgi:hypothetical protein
VAESVNAENVAPEINAATAPIIIRLNKIFRFNTKPPVLCDFDIRNSCGLLAVGQSKSAYWGLGHGNVTDI